MDISSPEVPRPGGRRGPEGLRPALIGPRIAYAATGGVPGLIRRQHDRDPEATACEEAGRVLSYGDLELLSDELAERLEQQVGTGQDPVVLHLERGADMVVAMLGVLKGGRPYLPVAVDEPGDRVATMLAAARPVAVVGDSFPSEGPASALPQLQVPSRVDRRRTLRSPRRAAQEQPVYVLFTSGSTGAPKGVVQGSGGLVNRLLWMQRRYQLERRDRVLQKTPYTFDVSGWEVFWPLVAGASCVLAPPGAHRDPSQLVELITTREVTVCHFVPSMLDEFLRWPRVRSCRSLRHVMCSGEALDAGLAHRFLTALPADLHNLYGPTEAAIDVTHWSVPPDLGPDDRVLIGAPIDNVELYVVDRDGRSVAPGRAGELWIGGVAVALGYIGRPDLTAERFGTINGGRIYRTGDLVRQVGAALEFLGRLDDQVKIRGIRVEPREVEHVLGQHPAVGQAVVVPVQAAGGSVDLAAALTRTSQGDRVSDEEIGQFLAARLPQAYIPTTIRWYERLPLGRSGKADRRRLRELLAAARGPGPSTGMGDIPDDPLAAAWAEALSFAGPVDEQLGFLRSGGHSLAAARFIGLVLHELNVRVPFAMLLRDDASLDQVRQFVARAPREPVSAVDPATVETVPLAPTQRRLWLLERLHPELWAYNVLVGLRLRGRLDLSALRAALDHVVMRHDALRAVIEEPIPGEPQLRFKTTATVQLEDEVLPGPLDGEAIDRFLHRASRVVIPSDAAPMMRARLLRSTSSSDACLALVFNHLVADQRSVEIVLANLAERYGELRAGRSPRASPATPGFGAYADQQLGQVHGATWTADLAYWRDRLAGAPGELQLPFRRPRPSWPSHHGADHRRLLGAELSQAIDGVVRRHAATPAAFFLACIATVLTSWSAQSGVVVGVPSSRRRTIAEQDLVGFLIDTLPLRVDITQAESFLDLLHQVRDRYLEAIDHTEPPFDEIVRALGVESLPDRNPVFQVWVNDLTQATPAPRFDGLEAELHDPPAIACLFEIAIYLRREQGRYRLQLVYATDLFDADVALELLEQCLLVAEAAARRPELRLGDLDLLTGRAAGVLPHPAPPPPAGPRTAIVDDVLAMAAERPSSMAVIGEDRSLDYRSLRTLVERIADGLAGRGIRPGDTVAVLGDRDPMLPAVLLGVWQAGAVVGLIDGSLPAARREQSQGLLGSSLTIAFQPVPGALQVAGLLGGDGTARVRPGGSPHGASHVLFTSGTTGSAAAVRVPHGPLRDFLLWYRDTFNLGPAERFALLSGTGHDPVLRDLFAPLVAGATLLVPGRDVVGNPPRLLAWLERERITVLHATPALLALLVTAGASSGARLDALRLIVSGGAVLTAGLARDLGRLAPDADLFNAYGTTETPQIVAGQLIESPRSLLGFEPPDATSLPVGRGVANQQLLVVTPAGRLAGVGQRGELVVRGRNLADGYVDSDAGTARPGAFAGDLWGVEDVCCYRTGDLGRFDPDGRVWFDGRADRQVSIHGHRLELAELEHVAAASSPAVARARAAVVMRSSRPILELRVVPAPGATIDVDALRRRLRDLLPEHAVPESIRIGAERDNVGDRKAAPRRPAVDGHGGREPAELRSGPAGPLVRRMAELLEQTVGRQLGPDENYFEAGLTSLSLLRLHAGFCAESGLDLPITVWFTYPNLRSLARFLESDGTGPVRAPARARRGAAPGRLQELSRARRDLRANLRLGEGSVVTAGLEGLVQQRIAAIWSELLDVLDPRLVHPESNFFFLGGDTLLAARMVARVRAAFGVQVPMEVALETNLGQLASYVEERLAGQAP